MVGYPFRFYPERIIKAHRGIKEGYLRRGSNEKIWFFR